MMNPYRIRSVLDVEIPDPPPPGPTTFRAIEKRFNDDGDLARSLHERFPFGLVMKEPPPALDFNWGEENFDFIERMLVTNQKMQDLFAEWSLEKETNRRLFERHYQQQVEESWILYLMQQWAAFKQKLKNTKQLAHLDQVQVLIDRVGDRAFYHRQWFISKIVEAQFRRLDLRAYWDLKARNNPNDNSLRWPSEGSRFVQEHNAERVHEGFIWDQRFATRDNSKTFMRSRIDRMAQLAAVHDGQYAYGLKLERTVVNLKPYEREMGVEAVNRVRFGKVEPGVPPEKKVV